MKLPRSLTFALLLPSILLPASSIQAQRVLFSTYIGAMFKDVKFIDVPVNPNVDFHYILSFAIDYTTGPDPHLPTNGKFNTFWDTTNLSPSQVTAIKQAHGNVKVALSIGGDSVGKGKVFFSPNSVESWVKNAVSSLKQIIEQYHLDGIDIDYEHFYGNPDVFVECIGQLILTLKRNGVISFASIAPYDDTQVQNHYLALWRRYGKLIDYVNFQFYAYSSSTTEAQFLGYFREQSANYLGGKIMVSYISDGSGGLPPGPEFFRACRSLGLQGKLNGIFVWSADDSKANGFQYERQSQSFLAGF